jgi:hypothetical protein
MRRTVFLILVVILFIYGCSSEKNKIKNLVIVYNQVLIDAYLRPEPKLMELFVSKEELIRIESYIFYLLKKNRILKCDIKELNFERISIKDKEAEVFTKERWVYRYLDARTRKPISKDYDITYSNVYYLKRKGDRWIVDRLDAKETGGTPEEQNIEELRKMHEGLFKGQGRKKQGK